MSCDDSLLFKGMYGWFNSLVLRLTTSTASERLLNLHRLRKLDADLVIMNGDVWYSDSILVMDNGSAEQQANVAYWQDRLLDFITQHLQPYQTTVFENFPVIMVENDHELCDETRFPPSSYRAAVSSIVQAMMTPTLSKDLANHCGPYYHKFNSADDGFLHLVITRRRNAFLSTSTTTATTSSTSSTAEEITTDEQRITTTTTTTITNGETTADARTKDEMIEDLSRWVIDQQNSQMLLGVDQVLTSIQSRDSINQHESECLFIVLQGCPTCEGSFWSSTFSNVVNPSTFETMEPVYEALSKLSISSYLKKVIVMMGDVHSKSILDIKSANLACKMVNVSSFTSFSTPLDRLGLFLSKTCSFGFMNWSLLFRCTSSLRTVCKKFANFQLQYHAFEQRHGVGLINVPNFTVKWIGE